MPNVFVSYRREDDPHAAGRIRDKLVESFGEESVFFDISSIPTGRDFRDSLTDAVSKCDAMVVVIGDKWLNATANGQLRLDDPDDFVRIEVETALQREIQVIPVVVGTQPSPREKDLPESMANLAYRQASDVKAGAEFDSQVDRLIRCIQAECEPDDNNSENPAADSGVTAGGKSKYTSDKRIPILYNPVAWLVVLILLIIAVFFLLPTPSKRSLISLDTVIKEVPLELEDNFERTCRRTGETGIKPEVDRLATLIYDFSSSSNEEPVYSKVLKIQLIEYSRTAVGIAKLRALTGPSGLGGDYTRAVYALDEELGWVDANSTKTHYEIDVKRERIVAIVACYIDVREKQIITLNNKSIQYRDFYVLDVEDVGGRSGTQSLFATNKTKNQKSLLSAYDIWKQAEGNPKFSAHPISPGALSDSLMELMEQVAERASTDSHLLRKSSITYEFPDQSYQDAFVRLATGGTRRLPWETDLTENQERNIVYLINRGPRENDALVRELVD